MHNGLQWLGALVCWAGFAGLALGQNRHFSRFYQSFMPAASVNKAQADIEIIAIFSSSSYNPKRVSEIFRITTFEAVLDILAISAFIRSSDIFTVYVSLSL